MKRIVWNLVIALMVLGMSACRLSEYHQEYANKIYNLSASSEAEKQSRYQKIAADYDGQFILKKILEARSKNSGNCLK